MGRLTEPLAPTVESLRSGEVDAIAYVEQCCDRIDAIDPDVRAFLPEPDRRERVRREATEREEQCPVPPDRPPLFGVPAGVKDIFHVDGLPTHAGSDLPPGAIDGPQAAAVTRLLEAGAVVLGKTVTTEFAYFDPGPTRNPNDLDHTPGGSSSGSAAAVTAGLCPLALGTQTAGSVVRPAAFCGVVGFKPSYGRIPTDGVIPLAPSLDTIGTFTQDVGGAALAAALLCDEWERVAGLDPRPDRRPTLGVPDDAYLAKADDEALAHFEADLDRLSGAGYEVVRTTALSDIDEVLDRHATLMAAEAAEVHEAWFEAHGDRYAPVTAELIREGREVTGEAVAEAQDGQERLRAELATESTDYGVDLWVAPAAPGPAPRGLDSTGDPVMNTPWTYAGVPAVTVPAGDLDGLPLGLQSVGSFGEDERLLELAEPIATVLAGT